MFVVRLLILFVSAWASSGIQSPPVILGNVTARPSAQQLMWMAKEVGVMITFNLQTLCVPADASNASTQACQVSNLRLPTFEALQAWSPPSLDTDAWLAAASSFGARYAVLVADHMSGFTLWPTRVHNVSIAATAWRGGKGDVVADFFASAARVGIAPGLFYSTHFNWVLGVNNYRVGWPRLYGGAPLTQAEYESLALQQLAELSAYRPFEIWFDGGVNLNATPGVAAAVRSAFPDALCHSCAGFTEAGAVPGNGRGVRWMGNEEGDMPLPSWAASDAATVAPPGSPTGAVFAPPSCDTVLAEHYWFFQPGEDASLRSTCALVNVYLTSVGRASNLILNMAPTPSGGLLPAETAAYAELGAAQRCLWAMPLGAWPGPLLLGADSGAVVVATSVACPPAGCNASIILQEDLAAGGQRIASWTLDACLVDGAPPPGGDAACAAGIWATALPPGTPSSATTGIGHKRILKITTPPGKSLAALRFTATSAYAWTGDATQPPIALTRIELFDRTSTAACLPAGCHLVDF